MENKQTAVEWVFDKIIRCYEEEEWSRLIEQAKEMEKEQIIDAWLSGQDDGATICTPNQHYPDEDYYNETYKKQQNEL